MRDCLSRNLLITIVVTGTSCFCMGRALAQENNGEATPSSESTETSEAASTEEATAPAELKAARFLGVTPGETTIEQVQEKLGESLEAQTFGSDIILRYAIGPFPSVDVTLRDDVVISVVAELDEKRNPNDLKKELGLEAFKPILVESNGEALGLAFPERGMLFSYVADSPRPAVDRIVLEPLSADLFLLRADASASDQYLQKLEDLERVLDLDPTNAEALWRGAKLLDAIGKHDDARDLAKKSVEKSRENTWYRLTLAKFTARAGDHQGAVAAVKRLLQRDDLTEIDEAHAKLIMGDLLATGLDRDFAKAITYHLAAVKAATPLVRDDDPDVRGRAQDVLIDGYLGAASDIAQGNWERKSEVVPKWLRSAEELATGFVQNDGADAILPLRVWRRTLEAYAGMTGDVTDTAAVIEAAEQTANELMELTDDALYKQHVQWELLKSHFAALRIEQTRARWSEALNYAGEAVRMVEELPEERLENSHARYLVGRLYFYVGSIYAINHKNHAEAVRWYERALPYFGDKLPKSELFDTGIHGERYVSMGVSYWEADLADEAMKLTEVGRDLMERATKAGLLDQQALVVPYANLAEMHRSEGNDDEAESFAAKVAQLEGASSRR